TSTGLAAGGSVTWTIVVSIDSAFPDGDNLVNTASIATDQTADPEHGNDSSTSTTQVVRRANLQLTKTASPDPARPGADETFTVAVKNLGPSDNAGYTLTDAVPAHTTFVSATSLGCTEDPGTGVVTCSSDGLANGDTDTYTIVVHVDPDYPA